MNYLTADASVEVGDRVLSSGYGSVYPRGLVIGYVEEVGVNPYTRGPEIKVRCAVEFSALTDVMILTEYEISTEDSAENGVGRS